jgi:outer membrane protein assembly factor BamC
VGRHDVLRCLLSAVLVLSIGSLSGCGVFGGGSAADSPEKRAERLRQPPDLSAASATGNAATPTPSPQTAAGGTPQAELIEDDGAARLVLPDSFYDAWRRVGLAVDRLGFTLEDRNRADGQYFVRYDPRADQARREKGFLESLAFWRDDPDQLALYVIQLAQDGRQTVVPITDEAGAPALADAAKRILALLYEQLR